MKKLIAFCSSFFIFFSLITFAQANVPGSFGVEYGLLVTPNRVTQPVPRGAALQTLSAIFTDYAWPADLNVNDSNSVCQISFLNCVQFLSQGPLDQKTFLVWWSYLQTPDQEFKDTEERALKTWYHLRQNGWLPIIEGDMTYKDLQTVLYRYQVSQFYSGLPYQLGMVLDINEINSQNYPSLYPINQALKALETLLQNPLLSTEQLEILKQSQQQFTSLHQQLYEAKHPFKVVPHSMPEDIRQKITENNLNEVLAQVTYNYSKDIRGRRHNVITGLMEINGRVYQAGDTINYFDVLKENGLKDYAMAHNLVAGRSVEGYGGGLCGATTILFQTVLNSGLFHPGEEGTVRYNHSALYQSLYPPGSIGKDAVTYFYSKTLILKNHFDSPVMFYVYNDTEKKEITLYLFGNSPYEYVNVSEAEKTGKNRYRVYQTVKPYDQPEEVRYLDSYYSGGLR